MSLAQLKQAVADLPLAEQRELMAFLVAKEARRDEESHQTDSASGHVVWPDVEERAKRIFGERTLPNLVLLEREESNI